MNAISSILVVVDRSPAAADAVSKAVLLAKSFEAKVELFMCDAERGYALSQSFLQTGVAEARRASVGDAHLYLEALRQSVAAEHVPITVDAECASPLYESIVRKVVRDHPDLVIKNAAGVTGRGPVRFDITDWQLMRTCPAALMLTRGRPWRARPRFAAAIDVSEGESSGLSRDILHAAQLLAGCAGGELDVIYAESADLGDSERETGTRILHELVRKESHGAPGIHVLAGNPEVSLPGFAKRRSYDAVLLGALTHRPGLTAQVGSLTSKLVEALECDFILVKPGAYRSPINEPHARAGDHNSL